MHFIDNAPLILVLSDDVLLSEMLGQALRSDGYRVVNAATGAQAAEVLATNHPAAIVTTAFAPGMDGPDSQRFFLATLRPRAPVLLLESRPLAEHPDLRDAADATLRMPFDIDPFLTLVDTLARPAEAPLPTQAPPPAAAGDPIRTVAPGAPPTSRSPRGV